MDFINLDDLINRLGSLGIKTEVEYKDLDKKTVKYLIFSLKYNEKEEKIKINSGNIEIQKKYEVASNIVPGKMKKVLETEELRILREDTILIRYHISISDNGSFCDEKTQLILVNYDKNNNKINIVYQELKNGDKKIQTLENNIKCETAQIIECTVFPNKCSEFLEYVSEGYRKTNKGSLVDEHKVDLTIFDIYGKIIRSVYNLSVISELIKDNVGSIEKIATTNKILLNFLKDYDEMYNKIKSIKT